MTLHRWIPLLALLTLIAAPRADAQSVRLGLGADYWFDSGGIFQVNLGVDGHLARSLSIGGRFGLALLTPGPTTIGIPIDFVLKVLLARRLYLEGLVGPWIVFANSPVRAHVAFGFGLQSGPLSFGLEAGWLDPRPLLGLRLTYRI